MVIFEEWAFVKDPVIVIPDESHSPKLLAESPLPPPLPPLAAITPTAARSPNWEPPAIPLKIFVVAKLLNKNGSKEL